jgi:hypothetical protein
MLGWGSAKAEQQRGEHGINLDIATIVEHQKYEYANKAEMSWPNNAYPANTQR